jgi:hypothetical protein
MTSAVAIGLSQDNGGGAVAPYVAGKNKILNSDFSIWQRGTSATPASGYGFGPDRFQTYSFGSSTSTISQQSFTPGSAPVAGYESAYFCRLASTNTNTFMEYRVEDVRTLANQTAVLSFWAKSASNQTITSNVYQTFGSGGSSTVQVVTSASNSITTSWARYTVPITFPSISGKTIGTGSYLILNWYGAINNNLDIWGVQLEAGSVATPFTTATGTLQGELAACQRYYVRYTSANYGSNGNYAFAGFNNSTTNGYHSWHFPVTMRANPSVSISGTGDFGVRVPGGSNIGLTAFSTLSPTVNQAWLSTTVSSGLTSGNGNFLVNIGNSGYIEASAEL